jgi:hypothetical protein
VKRHGDGRPSAARWYHRTALISRRGTGRPWGCASGAATDRDRTSVRRMTVVRRRIARRSGTDRVRAVSTARGAALEAGAGCGCASPPGRRRGRLHMPPAVARREDRVRMCTTALRLGRAIPRELLARTRRGPGSGRSSGQTVPTLGPPRFDHGAATTGAHPGAEAMLLRTMQVVRLKGALHRKPPGSRQSTSGHASAGPLGH